MTTIVADSVSRTVLADRTTTWLDRFSTRSVKLSIRENFLVAASGTTHLADFVAEAAVRALKEGTNFFELQFETDVVLVVGDPSGAIWWSNDALVKDKHLFTLTQATDAVPVVVGSGSMLAAALVHKAKLDAEQAFIVAASLDPGSGYGFGADAANFDGSRWTIHALEPRPPIVLSFDYLLSPPHVVAS